MPCCSKCKKEKDENEFGLYRGKLKKMCNHCTEICKKSREKNKQKRLRKIEDILKTV